jgi:hypothetical protein
MWSSNLSEKEHGKYNEILEHLCQFISEFPLPIQRHMNVYLYKILICKSDKKKDSLYRRNISYVPITSLRGIILTILIRTEFFRSRFVRN